MKRSWHQLAERDESDDELERAILLSLGVEHTADGAASLENFDARLKLRAALAQPGQSHFERFFIHTSLFADLLLSHFASPAHLTNLLITNRALYARFLALPAAQRRVPTTARVFDGGLLLARHYQYHNGPNAWRDGRRIQKVECHARVASSSPLGRPLIHRNAPLYICELDSAGKHTYWYQASAGDPIVHRPSLGLGLGRVFGHRA
jgi:hypothetical protein